MKNEKRVKRKKIYNVDIVELSEVLLDMDLNFKGEPVPYQVLEVYILDKRGNEKILETNLNLN